jgi:release factor glutamine methyltransferase
MELAYRQLAKSLENNYDQREAMAIANLVMEKITGLKRIDRLMESHRTLSAAEIEQLAQYISQLLQGKPLQYVLEEAWFAHLPFYVNQWVMIPRPETEELVEWIRLENGNIMGLRVLDIGTGSGCIPIALKKQMPGASIISIDKSKEALDVAAKNALDLKAVIELTSLDFLDQVQWEQLGEVDLIVSNPPYIMESEKPCMESHVLDHEPSMALFVPDQDPLLFYRNIAQFGQTHLSINGTVYLEINQALGKEVCTLFESMGYYTELKQDMQGKDRMVKAQLLDN